MKGFIAVAAMSLIFGDPACAEEKRGTNMSALIAAGQSAQIGYHLNRAMDNGLTAQEAGEIVTNAAFYAGWPNAFSAAPVVGEVLRARGLVR